MPVRQQVVHLFIVFIITADRMHLCADNA